jgi:membrane protein YdbS with pleckstrin-like domain
MHFTDHTSDPSLRDLAWVGYHPRALLPAVGIGAIVTALLHWARWTLEDVSALAESIGELTVYILSWVIWVVIVTVLLYRCVTYTYRLTDRALLVDFGFVHRPVAPVPLTEVVGVASGGGRLRSWFGIGWVEVRTAQRTVRMTGIHKPELFAEQIRVARAAARQRAAAT